MLLVSVIIPIYNCESRIFKTLESAFNQSYPNIEIILVDDSSTDSSLAIIKQFQDKNIKIISLNNSGAAAARNSGLKIANGYYIQFLDAGDVLSFNKIEKQVEALQDQKDKIAVSNYCQFTFDNQLNNFKATDQSSFIYSTDNTTDFLVNLWGGNGEMNFIQTNSWLVPMSIIDKVGMWRNYRCPDDDGEFFARVILASSGIVYTPGVYNYYHIEPNGRNQLSKNKNKKHLQNTLLTIDLKHKYLSFKGETPTIRKAIAAQYLRFAVDNFPAQLKLSKIAFKRYRDLNVNVNVPKLGGWMIELLKNLFGWRVARFIRFYTREV